MAIAMTKMSCPVNAWTQVYSAAGAVSAMVQNLSQDCPVRVRVGASVATSDNLDTAAFEVLLPLEKRAYALATSDKILVAPVRSANDAGPSAYNVNVTAV